VNAPLLAEVLLLRTADAQTALPLSTDGVLRYVWEGRFGPMLIEVVNNRVMVNGEIVEPADPSATSPPTEAPRLSTSTRR
jgi:hypothetical protein